MSVTIDIVVECEDWHRILGAELIAHRAANAAFAAEGVEAGAVSILLTSDADIRELNKRYRNKDSATNVLSFPSQAALNDGARFYGDVALAFETLVSEAAEESKRVDAHLSHLVVHGVLHLLGFDHENDKDAEAMESRERAILAGLGFSDPYAAITEAQSA
jgi:probable rRNA maturation factor